jgi:hypothetical protein
MNVRAPQMAAGGLDELDRGGIGRCDLLISRRF